MTTSRTRITDNVQITRDMGRGHESKSGMVGFGTVELIGTDGQVKESFDFTNLITDTGDTYAANRVAGAAATAATGMQIGSGTTAVAKNGAGAAMVTLLAGQAFDSTFPSVTVVGAAAGSRVVYKTTFAAGVGTGSVAEATITNGTVGTASNAGNTLARVQFAAVTKAAGDSLAITWNWLYLGS